jgi:hypothetical protein
MKSVTETVSYNLVFEITNRLENAQQNFVNFFDIDSFGPSRDWGFFR